MSPPGLPFVPMFPGGPLPFPIAGHGGAYDPHEARMDMGPPVGVVGTGMRASRAPIMPRMNQDDGNVLMRNPGELPVIQDLTPEIPSEERARPSDGQLRNDAYTPMNGFVPAAVNVAMPVQDAPADVDMAPPVIASQPTPIAAASSFRPPLRSGRARGTFSGDAHSFRPERRNDKTLVVEKIPEDKLSLEAVNGWFKKFGTVTNVAVDARNAKALVSFLDHTEAHAAWKSEDAVFNNRFVKVFWHRPIQGQGQTGARMLAASAPLVANFASKDVPGTPVTSSEPSTAAPASATSTPARKISVPSAATVALAAKKELLERQIAEQKSLMASLDTASPEEKKQIMGRLRKLGEEMKSTPSSAAPLSSSLTPSRQAGGQSLSEHERKERERLDKELDLHATTTPSEETTEDLKAKLAKLKAEVKFDRWHSPPFSSVSFFLGY
jgi:RNA-binding protein 26